MLLPEARLDTLIGQLASLPAGDRKAILARLTPAERERVAAGLRRSSKPPVPSSPFSPDIAERIAQGAAAPITPAAQAALAAAVAARKGPQERSGASLLDTFGGLLRQAGGQ